MLLKRLSGLLNRVIHESRKSRLRSIVDSAPVPEGALPESVEAYRAALREDLKRAGTILKAPGEERAREDRIIWFLRWSKVFRLAERGVADSPDAALWRERYEKERAKLLKRGGNPRGNLGISVTGDRVRSLVPEKLAHFLSLGVRSIEEYAFQSQLPDDLFNDLESLEQTWAENNPRWINEERQVEREGPAEDLLVFPDGWKWRRLMYACSEMEKRAMGHCGNFAAPKPEDEILSLREPIRRGARFVWKPHATFILNNGRLGEMKGFQNSKPGKDLHPYIVELLKDGEIIQAVDGGGFLPQNNFALSDLDEEQFEEVVGANPSLEPVLRIYQRNGMTAEVWERLNRLAAFRPEEGGEGPSGTGRYEIWSGRLLLFLDAYFGKLPLVKYAHWYYNVTEGIQDILVDNVSYPDIVEKGLDVVFEGGDKRVRNLLLHLFDAGGSPERAREVKEKFFEDKNLSDGMYRAVLDASAVGYDRNLRAWFLEGGAVREIEDSLEAKRWDLRVEPVGNAESVPEAAIRVLVPEEQLVKLISENEGALATRWPTLTDVVFGHEDDEEDEDGDDDEESEPDLTEMYQELARYIEIDENTLAMEFIPLLEERLYAADVPPWDGVDLLEWAREKLSLAVEKDLARLDVIYRSYVRAWTEGLFEDSLFAKAWQRVKFVMAVKNGTLRPETLYEIDGIVEAHQKRIDELAGGPIPWPDRKPSDLLQFASSGEDLSRATYVAALDAVKSPEEFANWVEYGKDTYLSPLFRQGFRLIYRGSWALGVYRADRNGKGGETLPIYDCVPRFRDLERELLAQGLTEEEVVRTLRYLLVRMDSHDFVVKPKIGRLIFDLGGITTLEAFRGLQAGIEVRLDDFKQMILNGDLENFDAWLREGMNRCLQKALNSFVRESRGDKPYERIVKALEAVGDRVA